MRSLLRRCRRSHTAAAAYTSLFLALGGTAYAAATSEDIVDETIQTQDIGKQAVTLDRMHDYSVNGAKVVDNSLSSPDIANGSLNSWDIFDGSLTTSDLADGSLTTEKLAYESVTGAKVRNGSLSGFEIREDSLTGTQIDLQVRRVIEYTAEDPWYKSAEASCPAGYTVLGGGGEVRSSTSGDGVDRYIQLNSSGPILGGAGWRAAASKVDAQGNYPFALTVSAICAKL